MVLHSKLKMQSNVSALRLSSVRKADRFSERNDTGLRARAKQAVVQELSKELRVKAEKMKLAARRDVITSAVNDQRVASDCDALKNTTDHHHEEAKMYLIFFIIF